MKWYHFWAEILFGLAILTFDKYAVFLLFVYLVIRLTYIYELLRKMIRVYQVANEIKFIAIMYKLKVSEREISEVMDKTFDELTEEQKEQLDKDFKDITGIQYITAMPKDRIDKTLEQLFGK